MLPTVPCDRSDGDFRKPRMKQSDDAIYYGAVNYGKQRPRFADDKLVT